jgi:hypothetical protein
MSFGAIQALTLRLELDTGNGDLLDKSNETGKDDIDKVAVQSLTIDLQATETDLAGGGKGVTKFLEGTDKLVGRSVIGDTVDDLLELLLQLGSILLPGGVLGKERLSVVVKGRRLLGGTLRHDVTGLVKETVDVSLELLEVSVELLVVLDILGSLLRSPQDIVQGLVCNLLDKGLEVIASLLNLGVVIVDLGLLLGLVEGLLGLVGVLLDEVDNSGDRTAVLGVRLSLGNDLVLSVSNSSRYNQRSLTFCKRSMSLSLASSASGSLSSKYSLAFSTSSQRASLASPWSLPLAAPLAVALPFLLSFSKSTPFFLSFSEGLDFSAACLAASAALLAASAKMSRVMRIASEPS